MNDILFYALIVALLYYFLVYLPKQQKVLKSNGIKPVTLSHSTQTEPTLNCPSAQPEPAELEPALMALLANLKDLNHQL